METIIFKDEKYSVDIGDLRKTHRLLVSKGAGYYSLLSVKFGESEPETYMCYAEVADITPSTANNLTSDTLAKVLGATLATKQFFEAKKATPCACHHCGCAQTQNDNLKEMEARILINWPPPKP